MTRERATGARGAHKDAAGGTAGTPRTRRSRATRPSGQAEVEAALRAATRELLSRRPYHEITIRDIAAKARVNHALIYRFFGSKERLLWEAMNEGAWGFAAHVPSGVRAADLLLPLHGVVVANEAWFRALAQLLLAGSELEGYERRFPAMRGLREAIRGDLEAATPREAGDPAGDAALLAAGVAAASMGWVLYRRFLVQALELDDRDPATLDRDIGRLVATWYAAVTEGDTAPGDKDG